MATIIASDNVSLDGGVEDPAGDEGSPVGGWVGLIKDRPELGKIALDEARDAAALLLGRRTYDWFAGRWPSRTGELADRLNGMPKFVVSSSLEAPTWNNTTVLRGDAVAEVRRLKLELEGTIVIPASFDLVHALVEHDLVDELRIRVFPVALGGGKRLFDETTDRKHLRLVENRIVEGDVVSLIYQFVRSDA